MQILKHYPQTLQWVLDQPRQPDKPVRIGINAPQGAGKTTLCRYLVEELRKRGHHAVSISIDDFYLTAQAQDALAQANPDEPLWQSRGYPGTHDIALGRRTLEALSRLKPGESTKIPRYDKSARGGRGDRLPEMQWTQVKGPIDTLFLEGWMLGFPRLDSVRDASLKRINEKLGEYSAWMQLLDAFLQIEASNIEQIARWRIQAEDEMRASGKPAMSSEAIRAYARSFLPAYREYASELRARLPLKDLLHLVLGEDRQPTER